MLPTSCIRPALSVAKKSSLRSVAVCTRSIETSSIRRSLDGIGSKPRNAFSDQYRNSRTGSSPSLQPGILNTFVPRNQKQAVEQPLPEDGKLRIGYVLHCKFTSNNTIITLTSQYRRVGKKFENLSETERYLDQVRPREDVMINMTAGLVGFRNTKQGEYEAGFQTAKRMFELMNERKLLDLPIEVIMSNFGKGREAFINALNGSEGNDIRPRVSRVTDGTKIRIGGVRQPRARRV